MTQEEMQKCWDACLIKQWRLMGTVGDLFNMYKSIVGNYPQPGDLLRLPALHHRVGVRVFVDSYLPKLNDILWKTKPEKDVETLRKLTKSKYENDKRPTSNGERDLTNARSKHHREMKRANFELEAYNNRNSATDWGVVKSPKARIGRRK